MCLDLDKHISKILVAKKDIPVWKLFSGYSSYYTPFRHTPIAHVIKRKCMGKLTRTGKYGYYSYACRGGRHVPLFKMYIPKGTKYVLGRFAGRLCYKSEYLRVNQPKRLSGVI